MRIYPPIVELREQSPHQIVDKRKIEQRLHKDDQVINFIQKLIANVNAVQQNNNNRHDVTDMSEPSFDESWVIVPWNTSI